MMRDVSIKCYAAPEDRGSGTESESPLATRIDRAARELAREVDRRESPLPPDPFDSPESFEQLLA